MRFPLIDILRIFAAFLVVFYHYLFRGHAADSMMSTNFPFGELLKYGYLGVDLFFIISGFVITKSIENRSLKQFIIARFIRLYPIY